MKAVAEHSTARVLLACGAALLLGGALLEFHTIAWGTGEWYGEFSLRWALAFVACCLLCAAALTVWITILWRPDVPRRIAAILGQLPGAAWIIAVLAIVLPILLLQYTPWGVVLRGPYLRIFVWALCLLPMTVSVLALRPSSAVRTAILGVTIVSGATLTIGAALTEVTSYPFSLGWSEGNRLWDYSLLFGKHLYSFDPGHEPVAYLDFGRQLLGGLPFLLPDVSILGARLWLAMVAVIPYLLVGFLTFWPWRGRTSSAWILLSFAAYMFLSQGPIHAPLLICAALVVLAWRLPLLWSVPLVFLSGFFAETSRFTWMFAPAIWIVMLELGGSSTVNGRLEPGAWRRSLILGGAGLLGSAAAYTGLLSVATASVGSSATVSTSQALLWYRLFPNATYGAGILLGLLMVGGPPALVLVLAHSRYWHPTPLQGLLLALSELAFLAVGLVVSTKIGGGGDLHNLDMFLIGMVFIFGIVWRAGQRKMAQVVGREAGWAFALILLIVVLPANGALQALRPLSFADDAAWLSVLADVERPRDLGSLPSAEITASSLNQLREAVALARGQGEVLFMDQRQLLTFGFIGDVKLVPEYEKKRMMDEALSANAAYFTDFYDDLSAGRFSLVISSPLRTPIKDSEYGFGEENNAWVEWVARPMLCYYAEKDTLNDVKVELLVPRTEAVDCASSLPGSQP